MGTDKLRRKMEAYVAAKGGELSVDILDTRHQQSTWYGGQVAFIKYKAYTFSIEAVGDVIATLLDKKGQNELAYVKDKGNNGCFWPRMRPYIKNDRMLSRLAANGRLIFDNNNWWECFLTLPNGEFRDLMLALNADFLSEAIREVADSLDEIIKYADE